LSPEQCNIFIREIKAHRDSIVCLNPIQIDCGGFITCSLDRRVRLWSIFLDLWGTINQQNERPDKNWKFPTDFIKKLQNQEIEQVKDLLDQVDINVDDLTKNLVIDESEKNELEEEKEGLA